MRAWTMHDVGQVCDNSTTPFYMYLAHGPLNMAIRYVHVLEDDAYLKKQITIKDIFCARKSQRRSSGTLSRARTCGKV